MKDIMKIVKSFDESSLLIKGVNQKKQLKMRQRNKKVDFLACEQEHQLQVY